jgi:hypothetical protein
VRVRELVGSASVFKLAGDGVPYARREKREAELSKRRPARPADFDEDHQQEERDAQRECQHRPAIHAVRQDGALDRGTPAWGARRAASFPRLDDAGAERGTVRRRDGGGESACLHLVWKLAGPRIDSTPPL